jgi:rubrerythrin
MGGKDSMRDVLFEALEFETNGRAFFLEAAKKTSDYFGKIIFNSLAEEELDHIEKIKSIAQSLKENEKWPPSEDHGAEDMKNIFETARVRMDEMIKDRTDDLTAVKIAIDLEQKGFRFYSGLASKAADLREKKFYQRLASEEKRHLRILEDTWSALIECSSSSLE